MKSCFRLVVAALAPAFLFCRLAAAAPDGAPKVVTVENQGKSTVNEIASMFGSALGTKKKLLQEKSIKSPDISSAPKAQRVDVSGHYTITVTSLPQGWLAGSFGAGPCIGLIAWTPEKIVVAHFTAMDNPKKTLESSPLPDDAKIYLFGGDQSETSDGTLASVIAGLGARKIAGYVNKDGLWIDRDGNLANLPNDKVSPVDP